MTYPAPHAAQPGPAERAARWAVVLFLILASVTLAFGLGYGVRDLRGDDANPTRQNVASTNADDAFSADLLNEIVNVLQSQYVDRQNLDPEALRQAAINGILQSLNDRETSYISADELNDFEFESGSVYEGIGATVTDQSGEVRIVSPYRDSPAEQAGILAGDVILEVDGTSIAGMTSDQAVKLIRGDKGTTVNVTVRHASGETVMLTITRGEIPLVSVFAEPLLEVVPGETGTELVDRDGAAVTDLAYINISRFRERTLEEFKTMAADIESKGYKGLILDLRSNPGGYLNPTVGVAEEFLNEGTIITEVDANGQQQHTTARPGGLVTQIPVVVLLNEGSASGSEVLAAALRDNGRAKIVGVRSFGKGTVNLPIKLTQCDDPDGCGALYVAIARWLTPAGNQIEGLGITPDIEVPMTAEQYLDEGDIQLYKAIEVLRETP